MPVVQTIIDNAILTAQNKANLADAYTGVAIRLANGNARITAPRLVGGSPREPNVAIPSRAAGLDTAVFNSMYGQIINDLANRFARFFTEYFPIRATLMPEVEEWLERAVSSGGTGINANVERQIWQRDRDRISAEAASASDAAMNTFAARGFPLPPGALNASVIAIQRKQSADLAAVSRDAAIKAFDTEIENVRFAVAQAIEYRTKAIAAAGDYIRALAVAPNIASSLATQSADAQARLISAAASFYNARTNAAELDVRREGINAGNTMDAQKTTIASEVDYAKLRTNAAIAAAESLGQQAAAALNGLNATSQLIESTE
jgi:hypothetical protein